MARSADYVRMDLEGPFFKRDPRKTVRQNITAMMDALASEVEDDVKRGIAANRGRMPRYTGHTHDRIVGRTESITGRAWEVTMVASANTAGMNRPEAIRTKAAAASIERRFGVFRRAARTIRQSRAVLRANLTKGLE